MDGEVIEAGKPVTMVNLDSDAIERTITITPTRVKQLLVPHILNGELAIELPSIAEKKAYIAQQLTEETWESELRIEMPSQALRQHDPGCGGVPLPHVRGAARRQSLEQFLTKQRFLLYYMSCRLQESWAAAHSEATVVKLADTRDLKSLSGNRVRVQAPPVA